MYIPKIEEKMKEFFEAMPEIKITGETKNIVEECYDGNIVAYLTESFENYLEQVVVNESDTYSKEIQIAFEVEGSVHQRVQLFEDISEEDVIQGLKNGTYITSTWINENRETSIETPSGKVIGHIISQEIEGEYHGFR